MDRLNSIFKWIEHISQTLDFEKRIELVMEAAKELTDAEASSLLLLDKRFDELYFVCATGEAGKQVKNIRIPLGTGIAGFVAQNDEVVIVNDTSKDSRFFKGVDEKTGFKTRSILALPLKIGGNITGVVEVLNKRKGGFTEEDVSILQRLVVYAASAIEEARILDRVLTSVETLKEEIERYARPVWKSAGFNNVINQAEMVAKTDSIVLLLGESGTGKEVIARYIHSLSPRSNGPFIPVNCAAIPENLFESELFGYEKGAFTGAVKSRKGYLERADGGTLLLDEITEIPVTIQQKLLRFIETKTFEKLGGEKTLKADIRIITATNRRVEELVKSGAFRKDLYYRLNVFPIEIPPLRDRPDDIEPLTHHFIRIIGDEIKKKVTGITREALKKLKSYSWPGNARELRNVIERAIIISKCETITEKEIILPDEGLMEEEGLVPLDEAVKNFKRKYIKKVLASSRNQKEASKILGIQYSYLSKLIKELGLK